MSPNSSSELCAFFQTDNLQGSLFYRILFLCCPGEGSHFASKAVKCFLRGIQKKSALELRKFSKRADMLCDRPEVNVISRASFCDCYRRFSEKYAVHFARI